jgi:hypothetical protein
MTPEDEAELIRYQRQHANARARIARIASGEEAMTEEAIAFMEGLDGYMDEMEEAMRRLRK